MALGQLMSKVLGRIQKALFEHVEEDGTAIGISDKADVWSKSLIVIARWCLKLVQQCNSLLGSE